MSRMRLTNLAVLLSGVAFMAVGCCDKEKQQIQALYTEKNDLMNQTKDLRAQLAKAKAREAELISSLDGKDAMIAQMRTELDESKKKPAEKPGKTGEGWERTAYGDRVTLGSDILFAAGKADLTAAGKSALNKIAADIKSTYAGLPVRVYGYTDGDPIVKSAKLWKDNLDLSANRAMAVTRHLRGLGVHADMIETIAMGETHPVADNKSSAGKTKNRRVEIIVIKAK
ncbi:MAG TPA: hypothetical protein DCX07_09870 [Phycisphaerales bacterium]|nr:hypothetical protein [Phycisphaerales bacterium]